MKESDLKKLLEKQSIPWTDWIAFIAHQTVGEYNGETFYWPDDIKRFFLQRDLKVDFQDWD